MHNSLLPMPDMSFFDKDCTFCFALMSFCYIFASRTNTNPNKSDWQNKHKVTKSDKQR